MKELNRENVCEITSCKGYSDQWWNNCEWRSCVITCPLRAEKKKKKGRKKGG